MGQKCPFLKEGEILKKVIMKVSIASPYWSYYPGQEVLLEDELAVAWNEVGHCKIIEEIEEPNTEIPTEIEEQITSLGGGWYQVPDGNKFQGKTAAMDYIKNPPKIENEIKEVVDTDKVNLIKTTELDGGVINGDNAPEQTNTTIDGAVDTSTSQESPQN
jgi:hypothetical protein